MSESLSQSAAEFNSSSPLVIAWGEVLWDCLPRGMFLGGAPFNVACHCARLGLRASIASSVGDDFPGRLIRRRAAEHGVDTSHLTTIKEAETGYVLATLDEKGNASYDIAHPVAWDHLQVTPELLAAASSARAIVFGSLAQRDPANRASLLHVLEAARDGAALRVFDVNLRSPFDDPEVVFSLATHADLLKLNEEELARLSGCETSSAGQLQSACTALAEKTGAQALCVTMGANGAAWWCKEFFTSQPAPSVQVVDTVGAGDSFLARLLVELTRNPISSKNRANEVLKLAAELGAFVASREGATPSYRIAKKGKIEG